MRVSTLDRLKRWGFEGSLSITAAILFSHGVISPLTIGLAGLFYTLQAKADFPVYSFISSIKEDMDNDYVPEESDSEDEALDEEFENDLDDTLINDGIRAQLFETSFTTFAEPTGIRRIPGMSWFMGEQTVTHKLPKIDTGEVAKMEYGTTRSGTLFRY